MRDTQNTEHEKATLKILRPTIYILPTQTKQTRRRRRSNSITWVKQKKINKMSQTLYQLCLKRWCLNIFSHALLVSMSLSRPVDYYGFYVSISQLSHYLIISPFYKYKKIKTCLLFFFIQKSIG
jgi:hypothetical protein